MRRTDRGWWREVFLRASERTLGEGFDAATTPREAWEADELGQRRALDRAFVRCVLGEGSGEPAKLSSAAAGLWAAAAAGRRPVAPFARTGRLLQVDERSTIEQETEDELSGIHAAWRMARVTGDSALRARCLEAAAWCVENLQPDNATNRPWAAHVFAELWLREGDAGAALYAETLLHNCQVMFGRPDRVSALVLWDASRELGDQTG